MTAVTVSGDCGAALEAGGVACQGACSVAPGTVVTASPEEGCRIVGWTGADCGTETTCRVAPSSPRVTVEVERYAWPVSVEVSEAARGTTAVSGAAQLECSQGCAFLLPVHASATVTAKPDTVSRLVSMTGDCSRIDNVCTVTGDGPRAVYVRYGASETRLLTVTVHGPGSVTSSPGSIDCTADGGVCEGAFAAGTRVQLAASAFSRQEVHWDVSGCSGQTCAITLDGDVAVNADFKHQYTVLLAAHGVDAGSVAVGGAVRALPLQLDVVEGDVLAFTALPGPDDTFVAFEGLPCNETEWSTGCTVIAESDLDGGLRFQPFVRWVKEWQTASIGGAAVYDLASLGDGGAAVLLTYNAEHDFLGTPVGPAVLIPNHVETLVAEMDTAGQVTRSSHSAGAAFMTGRFLTSGDELYVLGTLSDKWMTSPRSFEWGAVDAGLPGRKGMDVGLVRLDPTTLAPSAGAFFAPGPADDDIAVALRSGGRLIRNEGRLFAPVWLNGRFTTAYAGADGGLLSTTALLEIDDALAGPATVTPIPLMLDPFMDVFPGGPSALLYGTRPLSPFEPPGCPLPHNAQGVLHLAHFDSRLSSCRSITPIGVPGRRLEWASPLQQAGHMVLLHSDNTTPGKPGMTIQAIDATGGLLWRNSIEGRDTISVPNTDTILPGVVLGRGDDVVAVWYFRGEHLVSSGGNALTCPPIEPALTLSGNLVLTVHNGQTGALRWFHCLPASPPGSNVAAFTYFGAVIGATLGDGVLLEQNPTEGGASPPWLTRVGTHQIEKQINTSGYLLYLTPP